MTSARLKHLLPLALLIAGLVAVWAFGVKGDLSWTNLARHEAELHDLVARRPIVAGGSFVLIYAVLVACSVPEAALVTITGGLLFGTLPGGALAVIGASIGAVALFLAARTAFFDLMAAKAAPFMARIGPEIERDGFLFLLAIRLVPIFPFWLVNLAAAACGMRLLPFAAATLLGIIPGTLVFAAIGAGLTGVLAAGRPPSLAVVFAPRVLLPLLGLAALTLLPIAWRALKRRKAGGRDGQFLAAVGQDAQPHAVRQHEADRPNA